MRFFPEFNEVWEEWVDQQNPPVRATTEAKLAHPTMFVEIQVVAAKS
jgi:enamine deaminase RidA (YjgF/YER057c/UK114 family)